MKPRDKNIHIHKVLVRHVKIALRVDDIRLHAKQQIDVFKVFPYLFHIDYFFFKLLFRQRQRYVCKPVVGDRKFFQPDFPGVKRGVGYFRPSVAVNRMCVIVAVKFHMFPIISISLSRLMPNAHLTLSEIASDSIL